MRLSYDEVLDKLANDQRVTRDEVLGSALMRKVWVSGNGSPGCLYDNGPNYHRTKEDAVQSCAFTFDEERGCATSLRKYHTWTAKSGEVCEISQTTLRDIL